VFGTSFPFSEDDPIFMLFMEKKPVHGMKEPEEMKTCCSCR
jgi:hypothetical protein